MATVIGSKFQPFTYQELLAPVETATTAHMDLENQFGQVQAESGLLENLINPERDVYASQLYSNYNKDLHDRINILSKEGLNPTSRKQLMEMKGRYSKEIVPIQSAYQRRQDILKQQEDQFKKDPTTLLDKRAEDFSLDELIKNPNSTYSAYSGAVLTQQVAQGAKQLATQMRNNPTKWESILGGQYFQAIKQRGFRPQDIVQALASNPDAAPELTGLVEQTIESSGIKNWGDENTIQRAYEFAQQGLWEAVGEEKDDILQDRGYVSPYDLWKANKGEEPAEMDLPFTLIPQTTVDKDAIKGLDPQKLEQDMAFVDKIMSRPEFLNTEGNFSETDPDDPTFQILEGTKPVSYGQDDPTIARREKEWEKQRKDFFIGQDMPNKENTQVHSEHLRQLMGQYGVNNPSELRDAIMDMSQRGAYVQSHYQFEKTDNELAYDKLLDRINSYGAVNGNTGVFKVRKDGSRERKSLNQKDVEELFTAKENGRLTILHNTNTNRYEFVRDGSTYSFDVNVVDPSGTINQRLQVDKDLSRLMEENKNNLPAYRQLSALYTNNALQMNKLFGSLLNDFSKKQGISGE